MKKKNNVRVPTGWTSKC